MSATIPTRTSSSFLTASTCPPARPWITSRLWSALNAWRGRTTPYSKTRPRLSVVSGSAPRRRTLPWRTSTFGLSEASASLVGLGEAVAHVRHAESSVALRRNLKVKRLTIVLGRRARLLPLWRRRERRDGHGLELLIVRIGDE